MHNIRYETLEKLSVSRPVDRLSTIANLCKDKLVLDIGCFDETCLMKIKTGYWLHELICRQAKKVVGLDNSSKIPPEGICFLQNQKIIRGDATEIDNLPEIDFDLVVEGEFIEHIENPLLFMIKIKNRFTGKSLVMSTPNGGCFANTLLALIGREVQHHDHLHVFTFKTLNTLCKRAEFQDWEIVPYRFYATEMILQSSGVKNFFVLMVEKIIRIFEYFFPLTSFGYIVKVKL